MKYSAPEKYETILKEKEAMAKTKEKLEDSPKGTVYVTDNNLDEALKKYENLVVDCWAEWCMPCKMLGPVIDELAKENEGKIVFSKLNVDDNPNKARQYGIMSIPTLIVFKKGVKKGEIVGALPKAELLKKINELLK